jgi:hypothetical protein
MTGFSQTHVLLSIEILLSADYISECNGHVTAGVGVGMGVSDFGAIS